MCFSLPPKQPILHVFNPNSCRWLKAHSPCFLPVQLSRRAKLLETSPREAFVMKFEKLL